MNILPDYTHTPVLLEKSLEYLNVTPGRVYVDTTCGAGGHLSAILETKGASAIGIDRDASALAIAGARVHGKAQLVHANYSDIRSVLGDLGIDTVNGGILADLGVSSMQIDNPERGFSFLADGPLDMRMDKNQALTASHLVNEFDERELADIIFKYGEERHSRAIARRIVSSRPIESTHQLARIVAGSIFAAKGQAKHGSIHPATRTFQALRIAVNDELGHLEKFLREAIAVLSPAARIVVITFHSLEDRLVKEIFRQAAANCVCPPRQPICNCQKKSELLVITGKPILADNKEVLANPRARSAKLRAGEKRA